MKIVRLFFPDMILQGKNADTYLIFALLLIVITFILPSTSAAKLYRWVDEKGVSHFSNSPPSATAESGRPKKKLYDFREKVVRVLGPDVIELASGKQVKYIGVASAEGYARENGRSGGPKDAIAFHRRLVEGKRVTILLGRKKKDSYGRYLGHVFLGQDAFINAELIRQGYALTEEYPSDYEYQSLFIRLLKDAQKNARGIWAF